MKKTKKFLVWFIIIVAMLQLIKLGTWLMNQRDDYQFYLGSFIISVIFVGSVTVLLNTIYEILEKSKKK